MTGTGTDCVIVTCPSEPTASAAPYAGKHGIVGAVIGAAVRRAVDRAYTDWREDRRLGRLDIPEVS